MGGHAVGCRRQNQRGRWMSDQTVEFGFYSVCREMGWRIWSSKVRLHHQYKFQNSSAATESKGSRRKGQELGPLEVPILEGHVPQLLHWIQADVPLSPLCRLQPKQSAPVPPGPLFFSVYLQHTQTKGILPFLPGHSADHLPSIWEHVLVTQSCPALCDPVDCSPTGSSVHGIL